MAFDIEAAKADGFTDEEIKAYLASQGKSMPEVEAQAPAQPVPTAAIPPDQPLDRSAENATTTAMAAGAGAAAVGLPAALAYGLKRGVSAGAQAMDVAKQGINAMQEQNAVAKAHQQLQYDKMAARGQVPGPVAPQQPTYNVPTQQVPAPQMQPQMQPQTATTKTVTPPPEPPQMSAARNIVQKLALDKVLKGAGIAAGAYELGKGLFHTSPEEIAILKEQEAKRRAQGWKPLNER